MEVTALVTYRIIQRTTHMVIVHSKYGKTRVAFSGIAAHHANMPESSAEQTEPDLNAAHPWIQLCPTSTNTHSFDADITHKEQWEKVKVRKYID